MDPRLFLEASVVERQAIQIIEDQYCVIGDHRSSDAAIFCVNPQLVVNNWLIDGRTLNKTDKYSAILGDSLAGRILTYPPDQKVTIMGKDFAVVGVAFDPLNAGFVAYLPLNALTFNSNETSYNLVLVKIDPYTSSEALKEISKALNGTELQIVELNPILDRYHRFFQSVWSSFTVISLFFSITMALCLFTHTTLHITEQEAEIAIMRALGAKPKKVVAIVMMQAVLIILVSGIIGISTGLYASFVFLIPTPTIFQGSLLVVGGWLFLTFSLLLVSGLYSAIQIARKPLAYMMPKG